MNKLGTESKYKRKKMRIWDKDEEIKLRTYLISCNDRINNELNQKIIWTPRTKRERLREWWAQIMRYI